MAELRKAAIARFPNLSPDEVASRLFETTRKGFDPAAVRRFLEEVADELRALDATHRELEARLAESEQRVLVQPVLDEASLSAAVGEETARVLRAAHEAANAVLEKAETRAALVLEETEAAAGDVLDAARRSGEERLELTTRQCQDMLDEAREARRRILADLGNRRRVLHLQLEQLRAGKDALSAVVESVGTTVAEIKSRLEGAETDAREAGARAGESALLDVADLEQLVAEAMADFGDLELETTADDLNRTISGPSPGDASRPTLETALDDAENSGSVLYDGQPEREPETEAHAVDPELEPAVEREAVDELFARLRADQDASTVAPSTDEGARAAGEPEESKRAASGDASLPAGAPDDRHESLERESGRTSVSVVDASTAGEVAASIVLGDHEPASIEPELLTDPPSSLEAVLEPALAGDAARLHARDIALAPSIDELGHALKRTLRIEQNELLDALRQLGPRDDVRAILPGAGTAERIAKSSFDALGDAWRAGVAFLDAPEKSHSSARRANSEHEVARGAGGVATALGALLADTLQRRIDEAVSVDDVEESDLTAHIGSTFRDLRGERIADLASDFAVRAFGEATVAAARRADLFLRWVVDDGATDCPDCDDNALAGSVAPGEQYPTGEAYPPVHPGCRCMLVSASS